jgi:hypothetical protein
MYKLTEEQLELILECSLFRVVNKTHDSEYIQIYPKGKYVSIWIKNDMDTGIPYDLEISTTGTNLKDLELALIFQKELAEAICFFNNFKNTINQDSIDK